MSLDRLTRSDAARIVCPIRTMATRTPGRPAVREEGNAWTYGDLDAAVSVAVQALRDRIGPNPRIGLYRAGDLEAIVWLFAALRLGGSAVFPGDRQPPSTIAATGRSTGCGLLITSDPSVSADIPVIPAVAAKSKGGAPGERLAVAEMVLDAPATLISTSGSSGGPRVAVHSVRNHLLCAEAANERTPLEPGGIWLLSLPIYHVGGLAILFRSFLAGASVALAGSRGHLATSIRAFAPSHVSVVATQLRRLLDELPVAPSHLDCVLVGGGPVDAALIRRAVAGGYPVRTTYGMTEFSSQIATSDVWTDEREAYTAGRPLAGVEVRIGRGDEIFVRGQTLFLGYLLNARPENPVLEDGWFATGDIGRIEEGHLTVMGRRDGLFISGGENIRPEEIEMALLSSGTIVEAVVVPVPDDEFGHRPLAVVRWDRPGRDPAAVLEWLRERLPSFKMPVAIVEWPSEADEARLKVDRSSVGKYALAVWEDRSLPRG